MDWPFEVIYEDNHLLVVNKQAGLIVQGDITGDESLESLGKKYIKKKYNKPGNVYLGLVHRIDRPVSGLVILARTSKALSRMNSLFRENLVQKVYWAITETQPPALEGRLVHWLIKDRRSNKVKAYRNQKPGSDKAILEYRLLRRIDRFYLLEIRLLTGKPHQVRVQLSSVNCPIVGDIKYGYNNPLPDKSICLHSRKTGFTHPVTKKKIILTADLPDNDYWKKFKNI